jgi:hypothetical protein
MDRFMDLYWANIPISKKRISKKIWFVRNIFERGFLRDSTVPCFIWTGTGRIKKLEKLKFTTKTINKLKDSQINIYLYEPLCVKLNGEYNCSFYSEFRYGEKYTIVSPEFESIRIFIKNHNLSNVKVFTSDYNIQLLQQQYFDLNLNCLDTFLRDANSGVLIHHAQLSHSVINKRFWCGNWRYTAHRHLITAYLSNFDGNYSWNVSCNYDTLKQNVWFDLDEFYKHDPVRFLKVKQGVDKLERQILKIDQELPAVKVENVSDVYIPNHNSPTRTDTFLHSYLECFCAVINETRYAQPFGYFSEKALTAMIARRPLIMVAPPKTLEYLKRLGFKTFDKWWDESYDNEQDHQERLYMILDVIDYIQSKSLDELRKIHSEMADTLEHNAGIVKCLHLNNTVL